MIRALRFVFWTAVRCAGEWLGDFSLWLYWAGKHGQRRCRKERT